MPHKSRQKSESQSQRQRFVETARALECDEDEAAFDAALKKIGSAKVATPKDKAKPTKADH